MKLLLIITIALLEVGRFGLEKNNVNLFIFFVVHLLNQDNGTWNFLPTKTTTTLVAMRDVWAEGQRNSHWI